MTLPIATRMGRIKFAALRADVHAYHDETGETLRALQRALEPLNRDAKRKRERYANDPTHRAAKIARAKEWNAANPEAHRASNRQCGAAAARRYRQRLKERKVA